jgi:hypothetical protein
MPEIKRVFAQVAPNQVSEGFYTIEGGLLTMVLPDGSPVNLGSKEFPRLVSHAMRPEDNERSIAVVLTKQVRTHFRGDKVEGFSDPITYQPAGIA